MSIHAIVDDLANEIESRLASVQVPVVVSKGFPNWGFSTAELPAVSILLAQSVELFSRRVGGVAMTAWPFQVTVYATNEPQLWDMVETLYSWLVAKPVLDSGTVFLDNNTRIQPDESIPEHSYAFAFNIRVVA